MHFVSTSFLFYFFPVFLFLFRILTRRGVQLTALAKIFIILGTCIFYGFSTLSYLIPFFITALLDFVWGIALTRSQNKAFRKCIVAASALQNLSLFFIFKYLNWMHGLFPDIQILSSLHAMFCDASGNIPLPPGISFYIFESLSYVIDIYRGKFTSPKDPLNFFVFISMFPRFIAGPIVRYADLKKNLDHYSSPEWLSGVFIFSIGFTIKVLLADTYADLVSGLWGKNYSFYSSWVALLGYFFQIYLDFSAYSLMAIGLGKSLGFDFKDNFKEPYLATSITDFWHRWHISLSTWLRDYLYIPLGGSQHGRFRTYLNLFVVMVIGGIWHGANTTFLLWGIWHGLLLVADKAFLNLFPRLQRATVLPLVLLGWLLFRAKNIPEVKLLLPSLFSFDGLFSSSFPDYFRINKSQTSFVVLGILWTFLIEPYIRKRRGQADWSVLNVNDVPPFVIFCAVFLFIVSVASALSADMVPFLYFQF